MELEKIAKESKLAAKFQSGITSPMGARSSLKSLPKQVATTRHLHSGGGNGTSTPVSLSNFFRTVDRNFYF